MHSTLKRNGSMTLNHLVGAEKAEINLTLGTAPKVFSYNYPQASQEERKIVVLAPGEKEKAGKEQALLHLHSGELLIMDTEFNVFGEEKFANLQNEIKNCQVSPSGVFEVEKEIFSEEREEGGVLLFLVRSFPFTSNKK